MLCPVCNGLEQLAVKCPTCAMQTNDLGRAVDLTAPYAPYQPDDVDFTAEMTIMENGPETQTCNHIVFCPQCRAAFEAAVARWP